MINFQSNLNFQFSKSFKFLIIVLTFSFLVFSFFPVFAGGLVPCEGPEEGPLKCTVAKLFEMIKKIMDWMMLYGGIFAALFIAGGGIMMLISRGNPGQISKAKMWITNAVIGLLFIFIAWLIINTIMFMLDATHKADWWNPATWK